tara:strand:+ start:9 stop:509 length:501 start_codon:yes stop_codon:yes gene_type:complete
MKIKNRIKELREVNAADLIPNPKNWRTHPVSQQDALKTILSEVGYADALIARETPDGLMLIDGHLRAETTPDSKVPVLVLDVNEEEADLILATLDPLASMAEPNTEVLKELLDGMNYDSENLKSLFDAVKEMNQVIDFEPGQQEDWDDYDEDISTQNECPKCNFKW